ncbi:hypothetical protein F4823DRAFT_28175 [Ustulina deusta]|nr:hypothetical protein F4823DRAFT_28175 [Ustulina deusta]
MGQIASQPSEEEGCERRNDTPEQEQLPNDHPPSDGLVFSSQINSSINPAFIPPQRPNEIKYSSSPASRLRTSQPPTPIPRLKMSNSSPSQPSSAFGSSVDLAVESNSRENSPHLSKKKRRHKKRRSSASHTNEDHQPPIPHSSIDLSYDSEQNQHEVIGDVDVAIDIISASSAQARSQHKKEKKESKRAAKLAKRQAEASSAPEPTQEPSQEESRFREIWLSQERFVAAKREQEEEEEPEAHVVELAEPQNIASKKRRRKSQTQAENEPEQISKKHKKSHSGTANIPVEFNKQAHDDAIEEPEASNNDEIDFNDLAEQLYSGRKRKSHHEVTELEPAIDSGPVHEEPVEVMDVDTRIESDLIENGAVESEADSEVEEVYRDDNIDHDYTGENDDDGAGSTASEARSTSHIITTSASVEASREPTHDTQNGELVGGVMEGEVADHEEQNGAGINGAIAPDDVDGSAYDVEVPSSVPYPSSVGETSTKRTKHRASNKTSTGRKRVAKPDFFSRMVDDIEQDITSQSPSTAALSRRNDKDKGKQIAVSEDEAQAGPSTANGKARQPKITSMLKDSPYSDANGAMTPPTESVVRLRTPKTPATLSGAFSEFEIRNLTQAIDRFRDQNDMTQLRVNELIHGNPKESRAGELWECIVATCPGRSRQKIINQTRRRFHNFVARGTWTPEQDHELKQMYEQYGNKYALIGQFINRHPEDIRDRIRNYIICGDKLRKDTWSQDEVDKLVAIVEQAIEEISQQRANRGLDDSRPVEEDINWQLVSQGMDRTRSRLQCISKWKAMKPQLAGGGLDGEEVPIEEIIQQARETATTMSYRNRSLVIKEILKTRAKADSRIPWLKLRNELGGQWTRPPLMVVWFRLRRTLPNWQSMNVKETCTLLMQKFQQTHKLEYPDDETSNLDYDVEYREIEYRIKKGRKSNATPKSAAFIGKASDDEVEEENGEMEKAIRDQLDTAGEEAAEEAEAEVSHGHRRSSVDLSVGDKEREVEDSEPEAKIRRHRRRRLIRFSGRRFKPQDLQQDEFDDQSSDTNASQVSSIPAR